MHFVWIHLANAVGKKKETEEEENATRSEKHWGIVWHSLQGLSKFTANEDFS